MPDNKTCEHGIPRQFCTAVHSDGRAATQEYRELLLGCGHARDKRIVPPGVPFDRQWRNLVTLDNNPYAVADIWCDLDNEKWLGGWRDDLNRCDDPLASDTYDEVHAYELLEHLGHQGDAVAFFAHFSEIWRILKPGGYLCATVPSRYSPWLWGDPSHRRAILPESLVFLDQEQYMRQLDCEKPTPMSDFRSIYRADFRPIELHDNRTQFWFILQAVKPSRWKEPK